MPAPTALCKGEAIVRGTGAQPRPLPGRSPYPLSRPTPSPQHSPPPPIPPGPSRPPSIILPALPPPLYPLTKTHHRPPRPPSPRGPPAPPHLRPHARPSAPPQPPEPLAPHTFKLDRTTAYSSAVLAPSRPPFAPNRAPDTADGGARKERGSPEAIPCRPALRAPAELHGEGGLFGSLRGGISNRCSRATIPF